MRGKQTGAAASQVATVSQADELANEQGYSFQTAGLILVTSLNKREWSEGGREAVHKEEEEGGEGGAEGRREGQRRR